MQKNQPTDCSTPNLVLVVEDRIEISEPPVAGAALGEFRRGSTGRRRRAREMKFGPARWLGTDRAVFKRILVDRDEDLYHKIIVDASTGDLRYEQREKLSEHRGHGSDRRRRSGSSVQ